MVMTRKEFWERFDAVKTETNWQELHAALHREYYGAYVREFHVKIRNPDLLARCAKALEAGDAHMNSPFTRLQEWDSMVYITRNNPALQKALYANGEGWSLSVNTCLLKEAARQQIEAGNKLII